MRDSALRSFVGAFAAVWVVQCSGYAETEDAVLAEIRGLLEATHVFNEFGMLSSASQDAYVAYTDLLMKSARVPPRRDAGATPERTALATELAAIARSYAADPRPAAELLRFYQPRPRPPGYRAPYAPPVGVQDEHKTEGYRLAWEALLLAPPTREVKRMRDRACEALGAIRNSSSVPILLEAFRLATPEPRPRMQTKVLYSLSAFRNQAGLDGILACLSLAHLADERLAHTQYEGHSSPRGRSADALMDHVVRGLLQPDNPGKSRHQKELLANAKKWQAVIERYSNPNLSEPNKEFLRKLKSYRRAGGAKGDARGTAGGSFDPPRPKEPPAAADAEAVPEGRDESGEEDPGGRPIPGAASDPAADPDGASP